MKLPTLGLLLILCSSLPNLALSFHTEGHRIVANLAWYLTSDDTQRECEKLLADSTIFYNLQMSTYCWKDCTPFGSWAEWADDTKGAHDYNPKHTISIPDEKSPSNCLGEDAATNPNCRVKYKRDCDGESCVLRAIVNYSLQLQDHMSKPQRRERKLFLYTFFGELFGQQFNGALDEEYAYEPREALMYLLHLLGDMHQPLHCSRDSDDLGSAIRDLPFGNSFHAGYFWCQSFLPESVLRSLGCYDISLHGVWDYNIIDKTIKEDFHGNRVDFENDIWYEYIHNADPAPQIAEWLSCFGDTSAIDTDEKLLRKCVKEWANESLELALLFSYQDENGKAIINGTKLTEEYYDRALPVVRKQIAKGAVRLAAILDRMLYDPYNDSDSAGPSSEPSAEPSGTVSLAP